MTVERHSKITQLRDPNTRQENVGRLQITMNDIVAVKILEGEADLDKDGEDGLFSEGLSSSSTTLLDFHGEVTTVDVLGDEVESAELRERFDVGENARMSTRCQHSHLIDCLSERRRFWLSVDNFADVRPVGGDLSSC